MDFHPHAHYVHNLRALVRPRWPLDRFQLNPASWNGELQPPTPSILGEWWSGRRWQPGILGGSAGGVHPPGSDGGAVDSLTALERPPQLRRLFPPTRPAQPSPSAVTAVRRACRSVITNMPSGSDLPILPHLSSPLPTFLRLSTSCSSSSFWLTGKFRPSTSSSCDIFYPPLSSPRVYLFTRPPSCPNSHPPLRRWS